MKSHRQLRGGVAMLAAASFVIGGCSVDGEATSESGNTSKGANQQAEPSVDIRALDAGRYPINPRPAFGAPGTEYIIQYESQRMAEFLVVPFEVDAELTKLTMPTGPVSGPNNLKAVVAPETADVPANENIVSGWVSTFKTPDANIRQGNKRAMNNWVGRYKSAADASAAAAQMAESAAKLSKTGITTEPAVPGTKFVAEAKPVESTGEIATQAFTAQDVYVFYQWYGTTEKQKHLHKPALIKATKLQSKLISQFPRSLTKVERAANKDGRLPDPKPIIDQNKILIYALPYSDDDIKDPKLPLPQGMVRAVYGPRGMAIISDNPESTFTQLSQAGALHNALDRSNVYRTKDDAGAESLMNSIISEKKAAGSWNQIDSPKGLTIAPCYARSMTATGKNFYTCFVRKGRYIGEVSSAESATDAYQQIAAQYIILTKADQNAN